MNKIMAYLDIAKKGWRGILVAVVLGLLAVFIKTMLKVSIIDPLLLALVLGICTKSFFKLDESYSNGFKLSPSIFIPPGVILYGAVNLDFTSYAAIDSNIVFILLIVFLVYIISALIFSKIFGMNDKTSYLITTGSAICGASAIAITSKSIDAEPDDVSLSLIPVFFAALVGLYIVLPIIVSLFDLSTEIQSIMFGTVLQFTGFVKSSVANFSHEFRSLAVSIKAVRYVGLLFLIPLFSSFIRDKFHIPWYLLLFLCAGIIFSLMPNVAKILRPYLKTILTILWSIAMSAIGLNANAKKILSIDGAKSFIACLLSFIIAVCMFLVGMYLR